MKASDDKCHLLFTYNTNVTAKVKDFNIKNSTEEKLLGIKLNQIFVWKPYFLPVHKKEVRNCMNLQESLTKWTKKNVNV